LQAKNWEFDFQGTPSVLESMVIEAQTAGQQLKLNEIKGYFAKGRFNGSGLLDWSNGWSAALTLNLLSMDGEALTSLFSPRTNFTGRLDGVAQIQLAGEHFGDLLEHVAASVDFSSKNGVLNNFDFVSPVRHNVGANGVRGGSTRYEELSGQLSLQEDRLSFSGVRIASGLLTVNANMNANRLSGSAQVSLGKGLNRVSMPVRVGGEFDSPLVIPSGVRGAGSSVVGITVQ
jgi:uncharacterized protein involved in outer membrane biogenesis